MEIKEFKTGDEFAILDLFQLVFNKPMSSKYWYWRFQDNPAGKHMIKLMWNDNQLVGHYAVSPVFMIINNKKVLTALSMSTMTHPDFGGRGVFKDLSLSLYDFLENKLDVKSIWGFPNANSHYGFIKNLKWNDVAVVHTLTMNVSKVPQVQSEYISILDYFQSHHVVILKKITDVFKISVDRNLAYLQWRYIDNPSNSYIIFEYCKEDIIHFLVTKIYPSQTKENKQDIFIMEYGVKDYSLLPEFIEHIKSHYKDTIENFTIWCNIHDPKHIHLEKLGFILQGRQTFLSARYANLEDELITDYKNWYISLGDSDVY
jgi:hypothetical protein